MELTKPNSIHCGIISSALSNRESGRTFAAWRAGTAAPGSQIQPGGFTMTRLSNLMRMILIGTFGLSLAALSASAQQKAQVNVPFAFVANEVSLPAGHYQVLASDSSLTFVNVDRHRAEGMLLTRNEQGYAIATQGSLTFYVAGNRHVLTEAQFAGSSNSSRLLHQPKRERSVTGNIPAGRTVEIAMK